MDIVTDWVKIPITFRAKCYDCGKEMVPGPALWSDSIKSAKHLKCGKSKDQIQTEEKSQTSSTPPIVTANKDTGVSKHPYENIELKCFVCGKEAGCHECTFSPICDRRIVSQLCICESCSSHKGDDDVFKRYQQAFIERYSRRKK